MTVRSTIIIVYTHLYSSTAIFWVGRGGAGVGSKAPLVPSLLLRIFNECGSLELQDLGPLFFLESFDLQVCGLGLGHPPLPLVFFAVVDVECVPDRVGRSDWQKMEKKKKKTQEVSQEEAWYPSIIALEPGTRKHEPKINMAEKLDDVIVKLKQLEKKMINPRNSCAIIYRKKCPCSCFSLGCYYAHFSD